MVQSPAVLIGADLNQMGVLKALMRSILNLSPIALASNVLILYYLPVRKFPNASRPCPVPLLSDFSNPLAIDSWVGNVASP